MANFPPEDEGGSERVSGDAVYPRPPFLLPFLPSFPSFHEYLLSTCLVIGKEATKRNTTCLVSNLVEHTSMPITTQTYLQVVVVKGSVQDEVHETQL